ncbi:hypothetical protein N307_07865, partial [Dryobates pubescens]
MDHPQLADSLHQLLGTEKATSCPQGTEGLAVSGCSRLATAATQGSSSYHPEVSPAPAPRLPKARASLPETETSLHRATDGADVPHHGSHWFLSSSEQQVSSSAEEGILAGSCHRALAGPGRRWADQSSVPSTPELLRPPSPASPEGALRSRSASCFSALSSEDQGLS